MPILNPIELLTRLLSEPSKFHPCQLIVFEEFLVVFDTVEHKDSGELFNFKQGPDPIGKEISLTLAFKMA